MVPATEPFEQLLNVRDVAKLLGVCTATVYTLVEQGKLKHVRVLNSIRVRQTDLEMYLRQQV